MAASRDVNLIVLKTRLGDTSHVVERSIFNSVIQEVIFPALVVRGKR